MVIRVVVAEDSLLVREGIVKLLGAHDDIEIDERVSTFPNCWPRSKGANRMSC